MIPIILLLFSYPPLLQPLLLLQLKGIEVKRYRYFSAELSVNPTRLISYCIRCIASPLSSSCGFCPSTHTIGPIHSSCPRPCLSRQQDLSEWHPFCEAVNNHAFNLCANPAFTLHPYNSFSKDKDLRNKLYRVLYHLHSLDSSYMPTAPDDPTR